MNRIITQNIYKTLQIGIKLLFEWKETRSRHSSGRLGLTIVEGSLNTPIFSHQRLHHRVIFKRDYTNVMWLSCRHNRRTIQMLLSRQMSFKMATNGFQSSTSDFSIDHILNRAGERFSRKRTSEHFETVSMNSSGSSGDESNGCEHYERNLYQDRFNESERFVEIPSFGWLNYTRYNMPRLPRKFESV